MVNICSLILIGKTGAAQWLGYLVFGIVGVVELLNM